MIFNGIFPGLSRTLSFNFQDFPGPKWFSRTFHQEKKSRTFQEAWEPWAWHGFCGRKHRHIKKWCVWLCWDKTHKKQVEPKTTSMSNFDNRHLKVVQRLLPCLLCRRLWALPQVSGRTCPLYPYGRNLYSRCPTGHESNHLLQAHQLQFPYLEMGRPTKHNTLIRLTLRT